MVWVRIEDGYPEHPKMVEVGPVGQAMHTAAICYANRQLTDGFISKAVASRLIDLTDPLIAPGITWRDVANRLTATGVWEEAEGGWYIHDYLDYQPSRDDVEHRRAIRSDAGRKGGVASGQARRAAAEANEAKPKQLASGLLQESLKQTRSKTEAKPNPVPVPDPVDHTPPYPPMPDEPFSFTGEGEVRVGVVHEGECANGWRDRIMAEFWQAYSASRRGNRKEVRASLLAACRGDPDTFAAIMAQLRVWNASTDWRRENGKYIPYAVKWLGCWEDVPINAPIALNGRESHAYAPGKFVHDG